jgi:hypothetical protein
MSMSQDTFPRDVQTSVHNMVSMAPVPSEVLTYTYEANLNSEACAPLDPASSFLNHMMLEVISLVFSLTEFDTTVVWLTGFFRVVFLCDHSNKDSSFTSSFCGIGITKAFV